MSPDKLWKKHERETAIDVWGQRTWWLPADVKGIIGKVRTSVEVKTRKQLPEWLWEAVIQAKNNANEDEFPCVRLMERYSHSSILACDWDDFLQWFGFPVQGTDNSTAENVASLQKDNMEPTVEV